MNASRDITAFHKEMMVFDDRPEMVDMVIDYTSLLEDLIVKYDFLFNDNKPLEEILSLFNRTYDRYRYTIWTFPPSVITLETLKEEEGSTVRSGRLAHLTEVSRHLDEAECVREEAFRTDLYPSSSEVDSYQSQLAKNLGTSESALRKYFAGSFETTHQE